MSTLKKIIWKEHLKPRLHKSEYYWNSILLITWTGLPFTSSESAHRNRIFLKALSIGFLVTWLWKKNLLFEKKCRKSLEFKIKSHLFEKLFDTELYKTAMYYSGTFILRNLSNANISPSSDKQSKLTTCLQESKRQDTFSIFMHKISIPSIKRICILKYSWTASSVLRHPPNSLLVASPLAQLTYRVVSQIFEQKRDCLQSRMLYWLMPI